MRREKWEVILEGGEHYGKEKGSEEKEGYKEAQIVLPSTLLV